MTAFASQQTAVEALKEGAIDYLIKPFEMDELVLRIKRILDQKRIVEENKRLKSQQPPAIFYEEIVGRSSKMQNVYQLIKKSAQNDSTVLIRGESGTGKELIAHLIHKNSSRAKNPFVAINCSALPENLLESELFGYEKGAFTGAQSRNIGKFELADKGTIFLDEIGDLSLPLQAKLLRVIQNRLIYRLGGNNQIEINTRIITATHRDLEALIKSGDFREDLFYRINVFPIFLPSLRERKEDIPELVNYFIKKNNVAGIERDVLHKLMEYDWPGNVRELQNVIERASILTDSFITTNELPELGESKIQNAYVFDIPEVGFHLDNFEKYLVQQALKKTNYNKTRAAELLGITRRRLYSMVERFNLNI
jgi:two-component system response regulator AtoC